VNPVERLVRLIFYKGNILVAGRKSPNRPCNARVPTVTVE